jgi:hypothetical protein
MNEIIVKRIFEKHCADFKIPIEKEVPVENGRIDYEILSENRHFAIEAKGSRSDEYSTIGQLINAKRTYSHIYLLAPINFLKKVWKILQETNTLTDIGLMTVTSKGLHILKKPDPGSYFYNSPLKSPKSEKSKKRYMFINENDVLIESHFKDQTFTIADIANKLGITMGKAYHRIIRLKAAGMVEEVPNGFYPKAYRFVKSRSIDEMIEL